MLPSCSAEKSASSAAKAFIRRLLGGQVTRMHTIDRWVADEDTVVAFGVQQANSPTTGRSGEGEIAIRFDFESALISHYWVCR